MVAVSKVNSSGCIESQSFVKSSAKKWKFFRVQITVIFIDRTDFLDESLLEVSIFADLVNRKLKQRSGCFETSSEQDKDLTDDLVVCESLKRELSAINAVIEITFVAVFASSSLIFNFLKISKKFRRSVWGVSALSMALQYPVNHLNLYRILVLKTIYLTASVA